MREDDFQTFVQMLDDCYSLLGKGDKPSATARAMFFRAMAAYPINVVQAAFDAHIRDPQRGRFAPTPADLVAQIEGAMQNDGRPGPEQAWAMCSSAGDESATVVWTTEMAEAFQVASPLLVDGDTVAARMAFKEVYTKLIESARMERRPIKWEVSLGHDERRRHAALEAAEKQGLLPPGEALRLAPPVAKLENSARLLLENAQAAPDPQKVRERVAAIKAMLKKEPE